MLAPTIKKELLLLRRDPRVIVRLLFLPLAFIAIFGMVFNAQDKRGSHARPLALWADPAVKETPRITLALEGSKQFVIVSCASPQEVTQRVLSGKVDAGIVLPADFDPAHGHPGTLVFDRDASPQVTAPLEGMLVGIVGRAYEGLGEPPTVLATTRAGTQAAEPTSSFQVVVPGNSVLFGFLIALTCAMSFSEERRTGTWRRLLASPAPMWTLLVGKLLPYIILGSLQVGLLLVVGALGFGMKVTGSIPALALLTISVACCATTLGLAIAAFSTTEKQISSLGSVLILTMGLLGGCMVPRMLMPPLMQTIGLAVPHGWALDGYNKLIVGGGGFADVAKNVAAVFGFALLFGVIGVKRYRFHA
ncbi:MAG TPA: ABC transporter permease [Kofleriaceae bacterium]|nr:ABC transporter permease [Kofleriaceae bacterium]